MYGEGLRFIHHGAGFRWRSATTSAFIVTLNFVTLNCDKWKHWKLFRSPCAAVILFPTIQLIQQQDGDAGWHIRPSARLSLLGFESADLLRLTLSVGEQEAIACSDDLTVDTRRLQSLGTVTGIIRAASAEWRHAGLHLGLALPPESHSGPGFPDSGSAPRWKPKSSSPIRSR
jgi:hypothetical protein